MSVAKQNIIVTCGTGHQGHSVVKALNQNYLEQYNIRVLTHQPLNSSEILKQQALMPKVEFVQADLSVGDAKLAAAFAKQDIVVLITDHFDAQCMDEGKEKKQGENALAAIKTAGTVKHILFSSLESASKASKGACPVQSFDAKAWIADQVAQSGTPYTLLEMPLFYENFQEWITFQAVSPSTVAPAPSAAAATAASQAAYVWTAPHITAATQLSMFSPVVSLGAIVVNIVTHLSEWNGKTIGLAATTMPVSDYCKQLSTATGLNITFAAPSDSAQWESQHPNQAALYKYLSQYSMKRDLKETAKLAGAELASFSKWAETQKAPLQQYITTGEVAACPGVSSAKALASATAAKVVV
jgi:uncharacterized protein YbjT (DUF2867 family)